MSIDLVELWKHGRCVASPHYVEGHKAGSSHWQRINRSARIGRTRVTTDVGRWLRSLPATPAPGFSFTPASDEAMTRVSDDLVSYGMLAGPTRVADAGVPDSPVAGTPEKSRRDARESDALRRAYRDWVTGRAYMDRAGRNYRVRNSRTGRSRIAPWSALIKARFPDSMDFHHAALDWRRARADRKAG